MMRTLATAFLLLLAPLTLLAWSPESDRRIAKKGSDLAPPDLKRVIEKFAEEYDRGLADAAREEETVSHRYMVNSPEGNLRDAILRDTDITIKMLQQRKPMSLVIERLGRLAHLVADANNPFHVENTDPRMDACHEDFEAYFQRRLAKFPTVFYGLDPQFQITTYLDRTFARTASFFPLMNEEYFRFGEQRTSTEFDDRSTAFGVASICYSRSVTDLVNLYYYIWKQAGGDTSTASVLRKGNLLQNGF